MSRRIDIVGVRFSKLLVTDFIESRNGRSLWLCLCDCGNSTVRSSSNLRRTERLGCVSSCRECESRHKAELAFKHGDCKDGKSSLYRVWDTMRQRCENRKNLKYRYYGALGIKVCSAWQNFEIFKAWSLANGYKDVVSSHKDRPSIDRIDPTQGYSADNCEWVTVSENSIRGHKTRRANMSIINKNISLIQ